MLSRPKRSASRAPSASPPRATTTAIAISLSTSTATVNGQTLGLTAAVSASGILLTPNISGTLNNSGLAHSTMTVNGTTLTLGDTGDTVTAASSTLLGDTNTFSGNDTFSNTISGSISGNANTATTLQTARTINGTSFNGSANITITAASSTLLSDQNTWTKLQSFSNASTTLFSAYGPAYFGATATSSFNSAGALTLATALTVANGGTGSNTLSGLLQGNGTSAITAVTGTAGQFPYFNGTNTLLATSSLYLASSGNVGIGTTPSYKLDVSGALNQADSYAYLGDYNAGDQYPGQVGTGQLAIAGNSTNGARDVSFYNLQNLADVSYAFNQMTGASSFTTPMQIYSNGNTTIAGTLTENSDQRLKTNITPLDASSSLAAIEQLQPVTFDWRDTHSATGTRIGFIAQDVQGMFPELVYTNGTTTITNPDGSTTTIPDTLSLNYIGLIAPIVAAIQDLDQQLTNLADTVAGFAESFVSNRITASQELCVGSTCVTPAQFQAMVAAANVSQSSGQGSGGASSDDTQATDTPPVIQINGDNPAIVQVGDTYQDLGATITGPQQDLNLGITTYLDGTLTSNIVIDTSQAATDTIDYVATDQFGLTSTSTRTVIIQASPSIVPTDNASSTSTSGSGQGSATDTATSTAQ